ncbi:hypothetical protein Taro_018004, partial [Colocasia esculenta]|nr:hypothetical protein [Colocasia esculenta]
AAFGVPAVGGFALFKVSFRHRCAFFLLCLCCPRPPLPGAGAGAGAATAARLPLPPSQLDPPPSAPLPRSEMDDTCAVCADDLEWVAYGSCGHREVCTTCVVRMRFVLEDRRCCLCKIESPTVFVTKAMGDYTRVITDFSQFPEGASEGQVGNYWYHEDTQAYFDDVDQYRMIKAMCRLSCSVCDKSGEDAEGGGGKRKSRFKNIEQLKSHLHHRHKIYMCTLCLEGRKVFICEQKLYTRAQLTKHITSGDPEVDGNEKERGGFMGHPMCEFCRAPFYGDNELYMHMSTEHFKCHICQRQHPGQYDYFRNYDDLETHFRQEHFLCENEECLAKKFIVFQSESELKRHNAIEHGGNMSRSKRNAALQIPTSFRYRRSEHEQRRGRGRGFRNDSSENQLAMVIQASLEMANVRGRGSTTAQADSERRQTRRVDAVTGQLESLAVTSDSSQPSRSPVLASQSSRDIPVIEESSFPPLSDVEPTETSSRYAQALTQGSSGSTRLREESFPPLPGSSEVVQPKPSQSGNKSIAAHLRQRSKMALKSAPAKPAGHPQSFTSASSPQLWPTPNQEFGSSTSKSSSQPRMTASPGVPFPGVPSSQAKAMKENEFALPSPQVWPAPNQEFGPSTSRSSSQPRMSAGRGVPFAGASSSQTKATKENEFALPSTADSAWSVSSTKRLNHSSSAPNLISGGPSSHPSSVPPASNLTDGMQTSEESLQRGEDVRTANKTLVDRIRSGLGMDEDKFSAFKNISAEYRQGLIDTFEYLSYVEQFGLIHLVPELARLCPDPQKQKELIDTYNATLQSMGPQGTGASSSKKQTKGKGKGKSAGITEGSSSKDALADSILDEVRKLQSSYNPQEGGEVLSKDGYRTSKDKLVSGVNEEQSNPNPALIKSDTSATTSDLNSGTADGKQRPKKTSKFHRVRLGDGSVASIIDLNRTNVSPERSEPMDAGNGSTEGLPVRGVWRNGGGQKLFSATRHTSR